MTSTPSSRSHQKEKKRQRELATPVQYSNNQTRESTQQHQHKTQEVLTNQIILSFVTEVKKKYHPEDAQRLTETCRRILRLLKQYDYFNVLF